jgi:mannose-6-phosphate isomerase-like protein (cupin superfamily)
MGVPTVKKGKFIPKKWGHELWIENNDKYCGKLLVFNKGAKFSMHFHMIKDECWYVSKGKFECQLIDTDDAVRHTCILQESDIIRITPGLPHKLEALEQGSTIFEVSTQHFDGDSYRVEAGDSQL